jgi:hypothetical protein
MDDGADQVEEHHPRNERQAGDARAGVALSASWRRLARKTRPRLCFGTEPGPRSESNYHADFYSEICVVVGSQSAPIGTPSDLRSTNKARRVAETLKGSRFGAQSHWWGRVIFYVADVDALYDRALAAGYQPATVPHDAE